ncbi:hypothetical protein [Salisaeta longa]|uniref:hypothetical protein n=1 Tax=Salisaeta longa TaxID=503170 RepID=UPI0003B60D00|nr:hypothetical protein [Salisaeta longa]
MYKPTGALHHSSSALRRIALGLLLILLAAPTAYAQDAETVQTLLPELTLGAQVMQGAQFIQTENPGPEGNAEFGFQRVRFNFTIDARFHERITATVDLGHEPNDFGGNFAPVVDYAALDLALSDHYVLRLGTPVVGLFNFRGYSDGAAVQANPLIGNSPIDFLTAETGVQLVGTYGASSFDLTVTSPTFFETFAPGTGLSLIARGRTSLGEQLQVGVAIGQGTNQVGGDRANWILGDGENYVVGTRGQPNRYTHAYLLPGVQPTFLAADLRFSSERLVLDAWGGFATEPYSFATASGAPTTPRLGTAGLVEETSQMWWGGTTVKLNASEAFYVASRASYAANSSSWAPSDETGLFRLQVGFGVNFWDVARWKVAGVSQWEGRNSPGQLGEQWYGAVTELSVSL